MKISHRTCRGSRAGRMRCHACIDALREWTGRDPERCRGEAARLGRGQCREQLTWLTGPCGLGHGHANAIALDIRAGARAHEDRRRGEAPRGLNARRSKGRTLGAAGAGPR